MRRDEMDDHTADYWIRQIRIGAMVATAVTAIGGLRVALVWPHSSHWWLIPIAAAVATHLGSVFLPWGRLVRRERLRRHLLLWWYAELPILLLFGLADPRGAMIYLPGSVLLLIHAAAVWSPRNVIVLGGLCGAGYVVLLPMEGGGPAGAVILIAMFSCIVALTAINAQSRRRLDARRRTAEQRAATLLEASADAVLAIGPDGTLKYVSSSVEQLTGHSPALLTGALLADVLDPARMVEVRAFMARMMTLPAGGSDRTESAIRNAAGEWVYVDIMCTNWLGDPDLQALVVSLRDIGPRRELEEQLSRQAYTDSLTGLPNRAMFGRRLAESVAAGAGAPVTVLLLDLDDFKLVNDNLGHSAGDELLTTIAERLRRHVRPDDVLARLGGDEFAILLHDLDPADAAGLAGRLLAAAREPVRLGSRDITCSLSIGIAGTARGELLPGDPVDAEQLLGNADLAMYAAKKDGRNAYAIFDPTMTISVLEEAQQRADLEHALEHDEFRLVYQPVVDMGTRRMIGVEALVRWQHPTDGLLGPYHFIANAEANGLIVPLGRWVLREACAQLARWRAATPEAAGLKVNVNLSARQFQYAGLVDDVSSALADAGLDAASLTLEITESMLMADIQTAIQTLHALRALGVRLAIDDFGTGYSSLSYLKQLPVDVIKIDKTFVDEVHVDEDDVALVDAVAGLGQALKMQTVAEGIETGEQWATLHRIGIDHGQGYLFGRPSDPDAIAAMMVAPASAMTPA